MSSGLADEIRPLLCGGMGQPLRHLDSVDSTNSEALRWAADGAPHGALVIADEQTAGRGRWGRSWVSAPGSSLTFSVILRPLSDQVELLTTTVGVAVVEALREVAAIEALLKWPNDVIVDGRKLAGILVESQSNSGRVAAAVAGVGVNLGPMSFPEELQGRAAALSEVSSATPSRAVVVATILSWFEPLYGSLAAASGREEVLRIATQRSAVLGHPIELTFADGRVETGTARRLLASGALEVEFPDRVEGVRSAEITRSHR